MSTQIAIELLNGQLLALEVMPDMQIRELKQRIKEMCTWEDKVGRDTTVVELILGDKKLKSDGTVAELDLRDLKLSAVFRKNVARCCNKSSLDPDLDPDVLVVVEIPASETEVGEAAFARCDRLARVSIPDSVTHLTSSAFCGCSQLRSISISDSVTHIGHSAFKD